MTARNGDGGDVRNVFVVGHDPFNSKLLQRVEGAERLRFHPLLSHSELRPGGWYPFEGPLRRAGRKLAAFPDAVDAILGYWDFPVPSLVSILCQDRRLPAPSPVSVVRCEHKYWSRLLQREVAPASVPPFQVLDPYDPAAVRRIELPYPFWIKPVKSFGSQLGFHVGNPAELEQALAAIRKGISRFERPFNDLLRRVDLPDELAGVTGHHCIVEGIARGLLCTAEGFVHQGRAHVYGIVDSIRFPGRSSFASYQYPSRFPAEVQSRIVETSCRLMRHIGYDDGTFNIEYFWDRETDGLSILEINPRLSVSHAHITEMVDGVPHLDKMVQVALGRMPHLGHSRGRWGVAAKAFLRSFEDAYVQRVPSRDEIEALQERLSGVRIEVCPRAGQMLSQLEHQDSYSYELALVHIGGCDWGDVRNKLETIKGHLRLELPRPGGGFPEIAWRIEG